MAGKIFQDLSYSNYVPQAMPLPTQELAMLGATLDDKYNRDKVAAQMLEDDWLKVKSLDKDMALRNQKLQEYRDTLKNAVTESGGAYEKLGPLIEQQARKFKQDMTYGQLGSIQGNYNMRQQDIKDIMDNKDISSAKKDALLRIAIGNYQGVGEGGENGIYNRYSGVTPAKDVNLAEKADKIIAGWKADKNTTISVPTKGADGKMYMSTKKVSEIADENEIYKAALASLRGDSEVGAFVDQELLINNYGKVDGDYDIETQNKSELANAIAMVKQSNPKLTDAQAMAKLKKDGYATNIDRVKELYPDATNSQIAKLLQKEGMYQSAANFAAQKHGYSSITKDLDWKFNPEWEAGLKASAEKASNALTTVVSGGISNMNIDMNQLSKNSGELKDQLKQLDADISSAVSPVAKEALTKQKAKLQERYDMQVKLQEDIGTKAGANWLDAKNSMSYKMNKNKFEALGITEDDIKEYVTTGNMSRSIDRLASSPSYDNSGPYPVKADRSTWNALESYRKDYESKVNNYISKNKTLDFASENQILNGNESTYVGKFSDLLTETVKGHQIEMINVDGSQFDMKKQIDDEGLDISTIKVNPTTRFINGKPAFAVSARGSGKNSGKRSTYYVVMDDDSALKGDYRGIGDDLLQQAKSSKFEKSPEKRRELTDYGNMMRGYSVLGEQLQQARIHALKDGQSQTITGPSGMPMVVSVNEEKGVRWYNVSINGKPIQKEGNLRNFDSEESISKFIGENLPD